MEGRLDMFHARSLMAVLLVIALGLSACAAIDFYPSPRPNDLMVGQDEGLITRDWDGGYPLRFVAFFLNPVGVVADLLFHQTAYNLFALDSVLFGHTNPRLLPVPAWNLCDRRETVLMHEAGRRTERSPWGVGEEITVYRPTAGH